MEKMGLMVKMGMMGLMEKMGLMVKNQMIRGIQPMDLMGSMLSMTLSNLFL